MSRHKKNEPKSIENRKARYQYSIEDTLEVGIVLTGSEVKSVRDGQVSLAEGWIRASTSPLHITLHGVHIAYTHQQGRTLIPLKMYFSNNKIKVLVGMATGKHKSDKRQDLAKKSANRDMDRAMKRRL